MSCLLMLAIANQSQQVHGVVHSTTTLCFPCVNITDACLLFFVNYARRKSCLHQAFISNYVERIGNFA